jgi:hypothetical protein
MKPTDRSADEDPDLALPRKELWELLDVRERIAEARILFWLSGATATVCILAMIFPALPAMLAAIIPTWAVLVRQALIARSHKS